MATASAEGSGAVPKPILPQFHSPLLRLPGEIRNKIYEVYPIDEYDEDEVRYSYLGKKKGFENWIAQIREWYRDGI
ncbi:hypothetical protein J4E80_006618 [Alternaria sp. BMP 0032]|nr:hypothetical protein J4E80_006618 [Alternaria sp. BMP 0032]